MEINKYIDHTNLKAYATVDDIKKLCKEARDNHFETVCVNPYYVSLARDELKGSNVGVCTVVGFPLGMNNSMVKEYEAIVAVQDGADEIDMVINIGALKDKEYDFKLDEGHAYVKALDIPSDYDAVVLKTMLVQLQTIEEVERQFVRIEIL